MKILLTGSSGFLGKRIFARLTTKHQVIRLGRHSSNDIKVADFSALSDLPEPQFFPDTIVHVAGLAHITPKNVEDKKSFEIVNYEGTKHICQWIGGWSQKPKCFIFISSVSVYGVESGSEIKENHVLNGNTPYAESKIKAEQYLTEWGKKWGIKVLILRLPLIVGSNPPGNLGKMIKAIKQGTYFSIDSGKARKSMVLADDVANLINTCPEVAGVYNLTDGVHPSFAELESLISKQLNKSKPINIPIGLAKVLGRVGDVIPFSPINTNTVNKIIKDLTFSDLKARKQLGWNPSSVIENWKI